jgi:hypothetical protein
MSDEELLTLVRSRLYDDGDDDRLHNWLATQSPTPPEVVAYRLAKHQARDGNLEQLRKILTELTGDKDIADFIAQPPWPKHARQDYARQKPFERLESRVQGDTVRRIREIIKEETGKARVEAELVVEIAAKVLECSQDEIREIIKRGY